MDMKHKKLTKALIQRHYQQLEKDFLEYILKLLGEYSLKHGGRCYLMIYPTGRGWVVDIDKSYFEFENTDQLIKKLKKV